METQITHFAKTNHRNKNQLFGIKQIDRLFHSYIIGKTGTGKTTLLLTKILSDIESGRGLCLLDPHGDLVASVMEQIPEHRKADVVYLDIPNSEQPWGYNPLRKVTYEKRALVASGLIEVFKKQWKDAWGVKLEHILRYTLLALLDQPTATLADVSKMLFDKSFRYMALQNVVNPEVKAFWQKEFSRYMYNDMLPVLNKIGGLLAYPVVKRVVCDNTRMVSFRREMDNKRIILINLSKGAIGEDASQILGSLFLTSISLAAFSRVNIPEEERVPFMVYIDEFQNFTTGSLPTMLSECRKFKIGLILSHQYLKQLEPEILDAVLGNVGTHISFRIDVMDSSIMAKKFFPVFAIEDFVNLPNYNIYLTLMIDGVPSRPFSATTIPPKYIDTS